MAKVYAELLIAKVRVWSTVPEQIKESVKGVLKQYVSEEIITPETYEEIVGEEYVA